MIHTPLLIKSIVGASTILSVLQVASPIDPSTQAGLIEQLSRLGTVGFLALAVVFLWRKLERKDEDLAKKDQVLLENYKNMADALAANKAVVEKMSETLDTMKETLDKMMSVKAVLGHNKRG